MLDPITGWFVVQQTRDLARSALPDARRHPKHRQGAGELHGSATTDGIPLPSGTRRTISAKTSSNGKQSSVAAAQTEVAGGVPGRDHAHPQHYRKPVRWLRTTLGVGVTPRSGAGLSPRAAVAR